MIKASSLNSAIDYVRELNQLRDFISGLQGSPARMIIDGGGKPTGVFVDNDRPWRGYIDLSFGSYKTRVWMDTDAMRSAMLLVLCEQRDLLTQRLKDLGVAIDQ